jgi:cardiolipin synthase
MFLPSDKAMKNERSPKVENFEPSMMNLPNFFSIVRIILIIPFALLLIHQRFGWALAIFLLASVSDILDGLLARMLRQRTPLGAFLDPAADKLLIVTAILLLAFLKLFPGWLAVVVIGRDLMICLGLIILSRASISIEIRPSFAGKVTTALQLAAVIATLLNASGIPLTFLNNLAFWGAATATVVSGIQYFRKGIRALALKKKSLGKAR